MFLICLGRLSRGSPLEIWTFQAEFCLGMRFEIIFSQSWWFSCPGDAEKGELEEEIRFVWKRSLSVDADLIIALLWDLLSSYLTSILEPICWSELSFLCLSLLNQQSETGWELFRVCSPTQSFFCRYSDRNDHGYNSFCQNITITEANTVASPTILITAMQYKTKVKQIK